MDEQKYAEDLSMNTNDVLNKLITEIERLDEKYRTIRVTGKLPEAREADLVIKVLHSLSITITSLQQGMPNNMIQWTGNNLKEVIAFTGKSPRFGEWFKSWEEYENYVHTHNDILKLFCEDGSHYEVPVGAWIIKTPDGYNVPSVSKYIQQEQPMPDSTQLIEFWNEDKEMLKEKDFRDDVWRLAYNAFLCGFGRGLAVKKQEQPLTIENVIEQCKKFGGNPKVIQPEADLKKEVKSYIKHNFTITDEVAQIPEEDREYTMWEDDMVAFAKHFYELGRVRKEE